MNSIIYETEDRTIKVIDLRKEYTDYKENIPYAIVTNLSEEKLKAVLGDELKQYSPYVILSRAMYKAMRNSFLNDERERLRNIKYHDAFALDAAMCLVNELADPALICESLYTMDCILNRITVCLEIRILLAIHRMDLPWLWYALISSYISIVTITAFLLLIRFWKRENLIRFICSGKLIQ